MIFCFTTWTWTWTWTWTIVVVVSCRSRSCSCRSRSCRSRSNGTLERPLEMLNVECSFKILVTLGRSPTMELWKVSGTRLKPGSRWWKWYAPHHNWITRTPTGGLQKLTKNFTKNLIFSAIFFVVVYLVTLSFHWWLNRYWLNYWKSFSWVFKRGLIYFSPNNFSRFQIFLAFIILSCYS